MSGGDWRGWLGGPRAISWNPLRAGVNVGGSTKYAHGYSEEPGLTGVSITMVINHAPTKWHDHPSAPGWAFEIGGCWEFPWISFRGDSWGLPIFDYIFSMRDNFWSYPSLHHIFPENHQTFSIRLNLYPVGSSPSPAQVVVGEIPLHESAMCSEKIGINCSCFSVEDQWPSSSLKRWYTWRIIPNIFSNKPCLGNKRSILIFSKVGRWIIPFGMADSQVLQDVSLR